VKTTAQQVHASLLLETMCMHIDLASGLDALYLAGLYIANSIREVNIFNLWILSINFPAKPQPTLSKYSGYNLPWGNWKQWKWKVGMENGKRKQSNLDAHLKPLINDRL